MEPGLEPGSAGLPQTRAPGFRGAQGLEPALCLASAAAAGLLFPCQLSRLMRAPSPFTPQPASLVTLPLPARPPAPPCAPPRPSVARPGRSLCPGGARALPGKDCPRRAPAGAPVKSGTACPAGGRTDRRAQRPWDASGAAPCGSSRAVRAVPHRSSGGERGPRTGCCGACDAGGAPWVPAGEGTVCAVLASRAGLRWGHPATVLALPRESLAPAHCPLSPDAAGSLQEGASAAEAAALHPAGGEPAEGRRGRLRAGRPHPLLLPRRRQAGG